MEGANFQVSSRSSDDAKVVPNLPDESTIRAQSSNQFKPLYTVVSDNTTSSASSKSYYPRIRYIFDDDDPDLLSSALAVQHGLFDQHPGVDVEPAAAGSREPKNSGRAILLELSFEDSGRGYDVAWATSLSSEWAVTNVHLNQLSETPPDIAPENNEDEPLVLDIEGIDIRNETISQATQTTIPKRPSASPDGISHHSGASQLPANDYNKLIHDFEKRMVLLKRIVQNSEGKKRCNPATSTEQKGSMPQPAGNHISQ